MTPRTKREYLRQLVAEKSRSFRPLTEEEQALGFLGWHQRGYLPHCDYSDLVQFVTFQLADSMPASRRAEWNICSPSKTIAKSERNSKNISIAGSGRVIYETRALPD